MLLGMRHSLTGRTGTWLLGALLAFFGAGCIVSPRPEPPQATIDVERLNDSWTYGPTIVGSAGAAEPAGALVRAYNLDSELDSEEGVIEEDGGFEIDLPIEAGDEVRLQVIADDVRSNPVDLVVGPDGSSLSLVERPLGHCLTLDPAAQLDLVESGAVRVTNHCGSEARIERPRPRRPIDALELGEGVTWPATVPDGDSITVNVRAEPGFDEDLFFIEASAPESDRRPITLVPPP